MFIFVVGLNHRSAPVEIREKLSISESKLAEAYASLKSEPTIAGCAIISTCNRMEVYAASTDMEKAISAVRRFIINCGTLELDEFSRYFYQHTLYHAIRHLFRVSAGLDSMVLGETQILGQVRSAYEQANQFNSSNGVINTWFQQAITVGKRVRAETGIDQHAVSISYTAVELAKQVFGNLEGKCALLLGAGKMSELTLKHLLAGGVEKIIVTNRSQQRAEELASSCGGEAICYEHMYERMQDADIVMSCTAATHYVIREEMMRKVMRERQGKPVFLIDIAVPRDIEPAVGQLENVHLFDIDDLQSVVDRNLDERRKAAVQAEGIIDEEIENFTKWLNSLFVVPTIVALKEKGEVIKEKELNRIMKKLSHLSEKDKNLIGSLASSIVNQILHDPITKIRHYAAMPEGHLYSEILQNLFCLEVAGQIRKKMTGANDQVRSHHS